MTGTTCRSNAAPFWSPTSLTAPLTASRGTTISAMPPSADTVVGSTTMSRKLPSASTVLNRMSIPERSPLPATVMVCPGLAEAAPGLAGAPDAAVADRPVRAVGNAALTPPTVATRIGPVGMPAEVARLMTPFPA